MGRVIVGRVIVGRVIVGRVNGYQNNYHATHAIDGNRSTEFWSEVEEHPWITVDLDTVREIVSVNAFELGASWDSITPDTIEVFVYKVTV